jgi:hypothetical protein
MGGTTRFDLLFSTDRFNLSQPRPYFINDCCYGDDAARWLSERLRARGCNVTEPSAGAPLGHVADHGLELTPPIENSTRG